MPAVVFDPFAFKARYPIFQRVTEQLLGFFFQEATLYCKNDDCSVVTDLDQRQMLLWMLTAHIALLNGAIASDGQPAPVGAVDSATEGSVTVSFNYNALPGSQAWFQQTQFGLQFWQGTAQYRQATYRPRPTGTGFGPVPYVGR